MAGFLATISIIVASAVTGILLKKMKFKRDCENEVVSGVCSGLAKTIGIQPFWIRLGFLLSLLLFGYSLILYIVLWIVLPEK